MMKSILCFLRRIINSRLGQILFVIHLSLIIYSFAQKRAVSSEIPCVVEPSDQVLIAARPFHYYYESNLLKTLVTLDTPGMYLSIVISLPLVPFGYLFRLCAYTESWIAAIVLLVGTSVQWWLTGFIVEALVRWYRSPAPEG